METLNLTAEQHIIDFVYSHSRGESLLYNNRCFLFYINPSQLIKNQYEVNRKFILDFYEK